MHRVLVINPGSTSTKVAVYEDEQPLFVKTLSHSSQQLSAFSHVLDQYDFRLEAVLELLQGRDVPLTSLLAVVGRGGILQPIPSGTYVVGENMVAALGHRDKEREHASNLGACVESEGSGSPGGQRFGQALWCSEPGGRALGRRHLGDCSPPRPHGRCESGPRWHRPFRSGTGRWPASR
jgi:hypothetical protein